MDSGNEINALGIVKRLAGTLAPAAVFYAVGYMSTRAYMTTTGLEAPLRPQVFIPLPSDRSR